MEYEGDQGSAPEVGQDAPGGQGAPAAPPTPPPWLDQVEQNFSNQKAGGQLTEPTLSGYWKEVRARARTGWDFYSASKHFGVWYLKVVLGLPDAAIAAQAGWSERSVAKMVETYGHAVDERRLGEIDAAFGTHSQTQDGAERARAR